MAATKVKLNQLQPDGASTGGTIYFNGTDWIPQSTWRTNGSLATAVNTTVNSAIAALVRADPSFGQTDGVRSITTGLSASPYASFKSIIGQTSGSGDVYAFDASVTTSSATGRHLMQLAGGNSHAALILTNSSGTTDAYVSAITASGSWSFGNDSSDSGAFVLSNATTLGTNNRLRVTTGGQLRLPSYTTTTSFTGTTVGNLAFTSAGDIITTTPALISLNTLTGASQTFAVGTSGSDFNISSSGSIHTFNIPDAASSVRGLISTGTQSLSGTKNFNAVLHALSGVQVGVDNVTRGTVVLHSTNTGSVTIQPSNSTTSDYILTLPTTDGTANQFLSTDGSGILNWSSLDIFKNVQVTNIIESSTGGDTLTAAGTTDTLILNSNHPNIILSKYDIGAKQVNIGFSVSFPSGEFKIYDATDATKELIFNVAGFTTATTRTATWPNKSGTVAFLDDVSGGTPAGANTQIQYNNSGSFGASTNFEWVDASTRLDIGSPASPGSSRIVVKGAGTGATDFSFQAFNSSDVERLRLTNNGLFQGSGLARLAYDLTSFFDAYARIRQPFDTTFTGTSGTTDLFHQYSLFAPTSGTGVFNGLYINQQINQTGGANGITRGIFVDPALTAATDFRAIETTAGKVVFGGTNAIQIPIGTTGQRVNTQGNIRYNTTATQFEGYNGSSWVAFSGGGGGVSDADYGDVVVSSSGTVWTVESATTSLAGKVELATTNETTTGTDTVRAVTPRGLSQSVYGAKTCSILVSDPNGAAITTGDGKAYIRIPAYLEGMNLVDVDASLSTESSSGAVTVQIRRKRSGSSVDMLSTPITIDASETDSQTAATAWVINTSNDDVSETDQIYIDIDGAGTGAKGLCVTLTFVIP